MADPQFCLKILGNDGAEVKVSDENTFPVGGKQPMHHQCSTVSVTGPTAIVPAPGISSRIVVSSFTIQNESSNATTMILREGGTDIERVLGQNQGDGLARTYAVGREWRLPENTALNFALSGNNQCGYSIHYWVEAV